MARVRIGEILLRAGIVNEPQLRAALEHQRQWGGRLGEILIAQGAIDEDLFWKTLATQLNLPLVSLATTRMSAQVLQAVPSAICEKFTVFPVAKEDRTLTIAVAEPQNVAAIDEISFRTGMRLRTVIAPLREIEWAIRYYYHGEQIPCPAPRRRQAVGANGAAGAGTGAAGGAADWTQQLLERTRFNNDAGNASQPPTSTNAAGAASAGTGGAATGSTNNMMGQAGSVGNAESVLRESRFVLNTVVDLCVSKGIFTREEFLDRLRRLGG